MKYRPEIDGLRALALLAVIFYHAGFDWFRGGFVGVDVFFVISGFLITSIIITAQTEGTFSLIEFYERRARRILPALMVVMLACWPFAWAWMFPFQMQDFSESLMAVSLFVSNIFFGSESGYFASGVKMKPLLHTWSLAIEEQYYLFFPLFLMVCWRLGKKWLVGLMGVVACLSLAMAEWKSTNQITEEFFLFAHYPPDQPTDPFYLLWTRGWELLLGALLVISGLAEKSKAASRVVSQTGSFFGVALLVYALCIFDANTPMPSLYSLVPTLGAICLISFATPQTIVGRILGHRWLVGVGLISYSAYLWHHPLFAFTRIRSINNPPAWEYGILIICSLGLAYVTWRFIEVPFRDKSKIHRNNFLVLILGMSVIIVGAGLMGSLNKGFANRYELADLDLIVSPKIRATYVTERHRNLSEHESFSASERKKVAIVGDSFSQDFINMVYETGAFSDYEIRTLYIQARCQIYYGQEDIFPFIKEKDRESCRKANYGIRLKQITREADVVVFAAAWKYWAAERLPATIRNLAIPSDKEVIVVGRKRFGKYRARRYLSMNLAEKLQEKNKVRKFHLKINALMASIFPGQEFVNIHQIVCGTNSLECPVFTEEGKLISHDGGHLTKAGARFVGQKIFTESVLKKYR
jgi:peptidoglycan/LPS O-acetylase OafA/YrhL